MFTPRRAIRPISTLVVAAALFGAGPCGGDHPTAPTNDVASVQIIATPTNPRVGETALVSATPVNAGGIRVQGVACTYTSSMPAVAAAIQSGDNANVTGIAAGSTTITATCAGKNNSVIITVRPPVVTLTLTTLGSGNGTLFASPAAGLGYDAGTVVTVTQFPASGSAFTGWGGACGGVGACVVTMTANATVTATFDQRFNLTISNAGTGTGKVTANPPGLSYAPNTSVTLTAVPSANSAFAGWSGACAGTGNCLITMDANKAATATFALSETFNGASFNTALGSMTLGSGQCVFANSVSGSMTLQVTENANGTVSGTASATTTSVVVVTLTPANVSCSGFTGSSQASGTVSGTDANFTASTSTISGNQGLTFSGTRSGKVLTGSLTINATFKITDDSGGVTSFPFTKVVAYTMSEP